MFAPEQLDGAWAAHRAPGVADLLVPARSLARRVWSWIVRPSKQLTRVDAAAAAQFASDVLADHVVDDDGTEEVRLVEGTRKVVRRGRGCGHFVRKWVAIGKVAFPNVYGTTNAADVECVRRELARRMEADNVRVADIAKYLQPITMGVIMPSESDIWFHRTLATSAAGTWQRSIHGWKTDAQRTWWQRLTGSHPKDLWGERAGPARLSVA